VLVSLFCGAGGLDLGFEEAGLDVSLAYDIRPDSIKSYNANRLGRACGNVADIRNLSVSNIDRHFGARFLPIGLLGGPPCQSFSGANTADAEDDPRHSLPEQYTRLVRAMSARSPLHFVVFENVIGLVGPKHIHVFERVKDRLHRAGFNVSEAILDAYDYGLPQRRRRIIVVGYNRALYGDKTWVPPAPVAERRTVRDAISDLPDPVHFDRSLTPDQIPFHPTHWCMKPKSRRFSDRTLVAGTKNRRCFKTLHWDEPSPTVAYGNREVHVHPNCSRRLSVLEAMRLQGFPDRYVLKGSLSSQITQVSEAVPPPMASAVARSIREQLGI
jgi:DNA (cytosine-5)-methyltransferase 1